MKELKFKTTINCASCVARVTPTLSKITGVIDWKVDTENPDKILTLNVESIESEEIQDRLQKIGFKAELIS